MKAMLLFLQCTVIIFGGLEMPPRSPSAKRVQAFDGRKSFFNNVRFDFVTLFAQLWLKVFCLRSQNKLKNFHSALQISQ